MPFVQATVAESGPIDGRSLEAVWRERRYEALGEVAAGRGVTKIITAHTRGDQLESVLMRLLSGSAQLGMRSGVQLHLESGSVTVLRPLLDVDRNELTHVLEMVSLTPVEDPSNDDRSYRRNAVRHELLPIRERIFPGFSDALLRSVQLRSADAEYCDMQAGRAFAELVRTGETSLTVDRSGLRALHPAIASRVVLLAARAVIDDVDNREMSHERVNAIIGAADGRSGALIELPYGVRVLVTRKYLEFSRGGEGNTHA